MANLLTIRVFIFWTIWIIFIAGTLSQDHVIDVGMGAHEDTDSQFLNGQMTSATLPTNSAPMTLPMTSDGTLFLTKLFNLLIFEFE
jgi:hypothetical protein